MTAYRHVPDADPPIRRTTAAPDDVTVFSSLEKVKAPIVAPLYAQARALLDEAHAIQLLRASDIRDEDPPPPPFDAGVVSAPWIPHLTDGVRLLGARVVRIGWDIATPPEKMAPFVVAHAEAGARVILLAEFHATMPSPEQARALAGWAATFGPGSPVWADRPHLAAYAVRELEFGNETSYTYQYGDDPTKASYAARARMYAERFRDAQIAVRAANPNVGLLAQADDGNTGSSVWVDSMFAAVPDLASRVAGWTIHPYGPEARWAPRFDRMSGQLAAHGDVSIPYWATEYGISTDDGRCLSDNYGWDRCMTFDQAADALTASVAAMRARVGPRLRGLIVHHAIDQAQPGASTDREHYFGALRRDLAPKGAYTEAVRLLAGALAREETT